MRRGSCLKAGGKAIIGAGPLIWGPDRPLLPPSKGGGPPCSRNILIATSGGAGTNGPSGLQCQQYISNSQEQTKVLFACTSLKSGFSKRKKHIGNEKKIILHNLCFIGLKSRTNRPWHTNSCRGKCGIMTHTQRLEQASRQVGVCRKGKEQHHAFLVLQKYHTLAHQYFLHQDHLHLAEGSPTYHIFPHH